VWQESKLNIVLPNLPSECKFVIITGQQHRQHGNETELKPTKFEQAKIQHALEILSHLHTQNNNVVETQLMCFIVLQKAFVFTKHE